MGDREPWREAVRGLVHLRIVVPGDLTDRARGVLAETPGVSEVISLPGAAVQPRGDVLLTDVSREAASILLDRLCALGIPERGSISIEEIAGTISRTAEAAERQAPGRPADAVVWEQVEASTSESVELSGAFLIFIVAATLIAAVGIFLDSPILIVGSMIVGPEFGPLAGICVAAMQGRRRVAVRSLTALAVGFPLAVALVTGACAAFRATGVTPDRFSEADHQLSSIIASPDTFTVLVAFAAGVVGMLSLSTAKSSVLIGVLVSVTTIPAAANVAVSTVYAEWSSMGGSLAQLGINLGVIVVAGTLTLVLQRRLFTRRRARAS